MSEPTGVLGDNWWPVEAGRWPADSQGLRALAPPQADARTPPPAKRPAAAPWRGLAGLAAGFAGRLLPAAGPPLAPDTLLTPRRLVRSLSAATRTRALRRFARLPFFQSAAYLAQNGDVAASQVGAEFHALFLGGAENRTLFPPLSIARTLGSQVARGAAAPSRAPPADLAALAARAPRIGLFVSSRGNVFMREIAEDLAASLRAAGVAVDLLDETAPRAARPKLCVFVAPHEFFLLGCGPDWVRDDVLAPAVMLNTEQVQTSWFVRALPFLLAARGVIDLCAQTSALFAQAGLPSVSVGLAPADGAGRLAAADRQHPLFRVLPAAARGEAHAERPFDARPIEIAFFGAETPHRAAWLARNAGFLADYEHFIHCRRQERGPLLAGTPDGALTRLARHVCGHARVTLNLHRDAYGYVEWHRIVRLGLASGSVVVSEPCLPHPLLRPGTHYIEEQARYIPDLLEYLLRSADGRRRAASVQREAAALLAGDLDARATASRVLAFLLDGTG